MTPFDAGILGIVEGITEFLPVSSTGHLILASSLLGLSSTDFVKTFEIAIQLGAILAVVALYFTSFFRIEVLKRLIVAFLPTAVIGLALYKVVKTYLLGNETVVLWALILGGIALIVFELLHTSRDDSTADISTMSYKQALGIGLFQSIAIIPGVSRSAATIVGGLLLGMSRATIVEFSFLLAVPTMAAATSLDLVKSYREFSSADLLPLAIGFVTSFVVALLVIKLFLSYVRKHTFIPFGVYRILVSVAFLFFVLY
ncbi:MAG TPA: undecaprenyl-diphosphate phosphatase [Candidatus Paceibacterota bacterium]|nr:undecaprenyl-diphosphate phosphatase [Candidatus Paceibacterota bacterium]